LLGVTPLLPPSAVCGPDVVEESLSPVFPPHAGVPTSSAIPSQWPPRNLLEQNIFTSRAP
jgi:hypothetical protein